MRTRNVRPEFFADEDLAELPAEFRLLFVGLWCLADWRGRLEDRPKRIKRVLFPSDSFDVEEGLQALAAIGSLVRYEADGMRLIWIRNLTRYQFISTGERKNASKLPPHPDDPESQTWVRPKHAPGQTMVGTDRTSGIGHQGSDMDPPVVPRKRGTRRATRAVGGIPVPEADTRPRVTCAECGYAIPDRGDGTPEEHMCTEAMQA